jgi:hypothetical protein
MRKILIGIVVAAGIGSAQAMAAELTEEQARITAAWWVQGPIFEKNGPADAAWDAYRRSPNPPYSSMMNDKTRKILVLLRHERLRYWCLWISAAQQGHRDRVLTRATINLRRMVAIEFGM